MNIEVRPEELTALGISEFAADNLIQALGRIHALEDPLDCWQEIVREVLDPYLPFEVHQFLYDKVATQWDAEQGPMPAWVPSVACQQASNINALLVRTGCDDFDSLYRWSITERDAFWTTAIEMLDIHFDKPWQTLCDLADGAHAPRWLQGASLNIANSCFRAAPDKTALIYRREVDGALEALSYGALEAQANRVANGLREAGFQPGDALAIDMIMGMESVVIYLGILKAGCVVISVADSFSPPEITTRLRIGKAVGIFTMDLIVRGEKRLPMYAKVVEANAPRAIVVVRGEQPPELREGDLLFSDFLSPNMAFEAVPRAPHDPVNILFSSGTTGDPKAIPWDQTTPIKAAIDGFLHQDIHEDDVVCWPTNLGWMMGPWLVFAALVNRATIALYEQAPQEAGFCRFVADAGVTILGVVPSLVKAWRNSNASEDCDWSQIRCFSSTGECSAPADMLYLMSRARYKPVIEYCGGTEIGGGYVSGTLVQPAVPSTFTTPTLGTELVILDEELQPADAGEVFLVPPALGWSVTLLNKDHFEQYYQDTPPHSDGRPLRRHGDQLERLPGGYLRAHGRADDTMNLGGIKVSSADIERVLKTCPALDEAAAVAVSPPEGGPSLLVVFATLRAGHQSESLRATLQTALSSQLNPLFKIHEVVTLDALPRTASGKIMRRMLRKQYSER